MDAATVEQWFTRADGSYLCARWGRPLSPVVFGVEDATLSLVKGAFEAVCALTGHKMAQTDPELGANVMVFFPRDWADLRTVPDLDRLIEGLDGYDVRTPREDARRGGFVTVEIDDASRVVAALRERDVHTDARGRMLRFGPAPYVTDDEIDRAIAALREVAPR